MPEFVSGVAELRAALARAAVRGPLVMAGAMYVEAERIMAASRPLVPVDRGNLRGSGVVAPPDIAGTHIAVEFGYGGAASDYALVQHERLDFKHSAGQAKYLEQPANEAAAGLEFRLAALMRSRLEAK